MNLRIRAKIKQNGRSARAIYRERNIQCKIKIMAGNSRRKNSLKQSLRIASADFSAAKKKYPCRKANAAAANAKYAAADNTTVFLSNI